MSLSLLLAIRSVTFFSTHRYSLSSMLLLLAFGMSVSTPAQGQSRRETTPSGLDASEYFGEPERDALSEMLENSRSSDPSETVRSEQDDADEFSPNELEPDELGPNELGPDEPTASLGENESDLDEEDDEASERRKAKIVKQRALLGYLNKLQKPVNEIHIGSASPRQAVTPVNRAVQLTSHLPPQWVTNTQTAPRVSERYPVAFCHRSLYFQEVDLERCGDHYGCIQNTVSAGHFLYGVAVLPYRLATQCPDKLVKSPGDCRSGQTFSAPLEPLCRHGKDGRGLLVQAATIAGFSFLLL